MSVTRYLHLQALLWFLDVVATHTGPGCADVDLSTSAVNQLFPQGERTLSPAALPSATHQGLI